MEEVAGGGTDSRYGRQLPVLTYLLTYLLTHSIEQSPSWEANRFLGSKEIPRILRNPRVHYCSHKYPRTAGKGLSSNLGGLGEVLTTPHGKNLRSNSQGLGPGLILRHNKSSGQRTWNLARGINWVFKKWDEETWTGLIWLRIGTGDGLLRMR